jgi:hypothetical protein
MQEEEEEEEKRDDALYTHKRRIQASSLIRHGEKERLLHYC